MRGILQVVKTGSKWDCEGIMKYLEYFEQRSDMIFLSCKRITLISGK